MRKKWKIIMEKGEDMMKEGIIEIRSSPQFLVDRIESYGWKVTYLVPISEILDDEDTQVIELGGIHNANAI